MDQSAKTGQEGLPAQIDASARGHVPSDHGEFAQRFEDEQVRRALDNGHDRETVADILNVSPRSTYHKYKRAYAYEFPLDEFRRSGSGGQHPQAAARRAASDDAAEDSSPTRGTDGSAGPDADAGTDGQARTDGDEPGRVNQGNRADDVDGSDRDDAVEKSESIGFGEIDPEVLRMVNEAIIEQLSGDD